MTPAQQIAALLLAALLTLALGVLLLATWRLLAAMERLARHARDAALIQRQIDRSRL